MTQSEMTPKLTIHNTDPKLWFALTLAYPVVKSSKAPTKWINVPMKGSEITFFMPRK